MSILIHLYMSIALPALFMYLSFSRFIRLSYNLTVYFVLLCNCSVFSVVTVKNENYNKNKNKKNKKNKKTIGFFTGFKKINQRRISFVLGYLRMISWKISPAITENSDGNAMNYSQLFKAN
jgi:hypothetical protein